MNPSDDVVKSGLLEPLVALGVDLESVEVQKAGRRHVVRVVVDRDGGVDLDLIAEVSRQVSELLDVPPLSDELPGPFVLEVTSPGVDRPLTEPRHWRRAVTRLVNVTLLDDTVVDGRVAAVPSDDAALIDTATGQVEVAFANVRRAMVQVEFSRADVPDAESSDTEVADNDEEGE